jgi:hypothetical protein
MADKTKLYAVAATGLVPLVCLASVGPFAKGDVSGFDPDKAAQLIATNRFKLSAKAEGVKYVAVEVDKPAADTDLEAAEKARAEAAEEKTKREAAEKALSDTSTELDSLRKELAALKTPKPPKE